MGSSPQLDGLPPEVLLKIYELVDETNHETILTLASLNRYLHSLSHQFLFHTVYLAVNPKFGRTVPVRNCHELIQRKDAFRHVRRLFIADVSPKWHIANDPKNHTVPFAAIDAVAEENSQQFDIYADGRTHLIGYYDLKEPVADQNDGPGDAYRQDNSWEPLAALMRQLPLLSELHFSCTSQFPPCLLEALHQGLPQCKLFINAFRLRSLNGLGDPDAHELRLVTSPNLHSVRMSVRKPTDTDVFTNVHGHLVDSTPRIVAVMAPNLKELQVNRHNLEGHVDENPSPGWKALVGEKKATPLTLLTMLKLVSDESWPIGPVEIDRWGNTIDFSSLLTLDISSHDDRRLDQLFLYMVLRYKFLSLTKLNIMIDTFLKLDCLESWIANELPSLTSLFLIYLDSTSPSIWVSVSSQSLRTLCVRGRSVGTTEVEELGTQCPMLEDLAVTIVRSKGDEGETSVYRTIGRCLPRLRCLALTLFARSPDLEGFWPVRETDPTFDEFDLTPVSGRWGSEGYLKGYFRDYFVNNGIDAALAQAIFDEVSSCKVQGGQAPLHTLQVRTSPAPYLAFEVVNDIAVELRRSWRIERWGGDITVREIDAPILSARSRIEWNEETEEWLQILDRIWPSNGATAWPWVWRSLPLYKGDSSIDGQ
ncbi:hypothetical protein OQA88_1201 [Cercophora sp. LCS_1]